MRCSGGLLNSSSERQSFNPQPKAQAGEASAVTCRATVIDPRYLPNRG